MSNPNIPKWCALPNHAIPRVLFKALCMIAISKSSVEHWEELRQISIKNSEELERNSTEPKRNSMDEKWEKHKKMLINRFENMNITAGLVLTSSAVFISTIPRNNPISYTLRKRSYILLVISFVTALMSLMTGTSVLIIYDTCYAHKDVLESFKESRLRLIICLLLMAFPTLALIVSTFALMSAIYIAGFTSDKPYVKVLTGLACVILFLLAGLAIYVFNAPIKKAAHGTGNVINV
ncbi:hypothetical protein DFJ58DRAFT_727019 [Suillus subalutaceus]|uniref:uncharacterized protein n=1 Tax=Suillus subalutaceus TaxID=48586 RepID=UPI001B879EFF|nr:uncharacterized protein DFJ58DRAFT_727019 [Suillus subalutaceus]KAG1857002.1 hypothetical protein DFJ58DRAFT_727019 [Suillus subalutaceus]